MKGLSFILLTLITLSFSAFGNDNDPVVQAFTSYRECVKNSFLQAQQANKSFDLSSVCLNQKKNHSNYYQLKAKRL